jgi:hypothetical protein
MNQPDLDLLADYVGGVLDGTPEAAEVGERIRKDIAWAAAHAQLVAALDEIGGRLRELGEQPEPMPDDVWARMAAAFAAEEPLTPAEEPDSGEHGSGERWVRQISASGAPADNRPGGRARTRRRRWAPVLVGVAIFAALGIGISVLRPMFDATQNGGTADTKAAAPASGLGASVLAVATGRDYTESTLVLATDFGNASALSARPEAARSDTTKDREPSPLWSFASPVPTALSRLTTPEALDQCLRSVSATLPGDVVGVDFARYAGSPALIVVIRAADDSRWVGVTGPSCGETGSDLRLQKRVA